MPDLLLAAYLLGFMPARSLWQSLNNSPASERTSRYSTTIAEIAMLLKGLVLVSFLAGRSAESLGLDWPLSGAGLWGLAGAVVVLAGLWLASNMSGRSLTAEQRAEREAKVLEHDAMPTTGHELRMFLLTSLFVGAGWELLYRGFLLSVLIPYIDVIPAIAASAVAYGLAHGYKNPRQLIGSIVAALLFTVAYYLTQSLWWLMMIHAGFGIIIALAAYKVARNIPAAPAQAA